MKISVCVGPQEKTSSCLNEMGQQQEGGRGREGGFYQPGQWTAEGQGRLDSEAEVGSHDCSRDEVLLGQRASRPPSEDTSLKPVGGSWVCSLYWGLFLTWSVEVALVSCGCRNQLPHTGWLGTTEIASLHFLEPRILTCRCWRWLVASEGPPGRVLPCLCQLRVAVSFPWFGAT